MPDAVARMREIEAEGGWGVVSTEIAEIGPESEFWPFPKIGDAPHPIAAAGHRWARALDNPSERTPPLPHP